MAQVEVWDSAAFEAASAQGVVLADFWGDGCGPCKMMMPVLEKAAAEFAPGVRVGKVNIREARDLAVRFRVATIPTFVVLKDGELVSSISGVVSKEKLVAAVAAALA